MHIYICIYIERERDWQKRDVLIQEIDNSDIFR